MKKLLNRRRQGFTLIETLVVIGIVTILAALIVPVFSRAKVAAKRTNGLTNLKQIGLTSLMYSHDYDDTLPAGLPGISFNANPAAPFPHVEALLATYGAPNELFHGPEDKCTSIVSNCVNTFLQSFGSS